VLHSIAESKEIECLPNMKGALVRHFQEFPSTENGLSLTEQMSLDMLNEQSMTAGLMFKKMMTERDPLPWLGDIMYWYILGSMMQAEKPVFAVSASDLQKPWVERVLTITQTGREVLSGSQSWLSLNPPTRWLGGVKLHDHNPCWQWRLDGRNGRFIWHFA
jgi:hypothetical protein